MTDIYQPPQSDLEKAPSGEQIGGAVENGLTGNYQFDIGETLKEAWELTYGAKWTLWLAIIIFLAINIGATIVAEIITTLFGMLIPVEGFKDFLEIIVTLGLILVITPIEVGIFILGVRRSAGESSESTSIMNYFSRMLPLFFTYLLMIVMIILGLLLLILPGIYLMFAYYFALPLVVEKEMGPWQALETSRKTITHRWFTFFFITIIILLIVLVSMIAGLIGLIWTVPLSIIAYGIIYRNMLGIEKETLA